MDKQIIVELLENNILNYSISKQLQDGSTIIVIDWQRFMSLGKTQYGLMNRFFFIDLLVSPVNRDANEADGLSPYFLVTQTSVNGEPDIQTVHVGVYRDTDGSYASQIPLINSNWKGIYWNLMYPMFKAA